MKVTMGQDGGSLLVSLEGRLDTVTAPELEAQLKPVLDGVTELTFDLEKLEYMSSAGLWLLLSTQKVMNRQGKMRVRNANDAVMDVFTVTGFANILNIE